MFNEYQMNQINHKQFIYWRKHIYNLTTFKIHIPIFRILQRIEFVLHFDHL